jgi:hypothetical protein
MRFWLQKFASSANVSQKVVFQKFNCGIKSESESVEKNAKRFKGAQA